MPGRARCSNERRKRPLGAGLIVLAVVLAVRLAAGMPPQDQQTPSRLFQQALTLMETRGDLDEAIRLLEVVARSGDRRLAAHALLSLGVCYERLGRREAAKYYEQVIASYPEERAVVEQAKTRLALLLRGSEAAARATVNRLAWPAAPDNAGASRVSLDGKVVAFLDGQQFVLANAHTGAPGRRVPLQPALPANSAIFAPVVLSPTGTEAVFTWESSDGRAHFSVVRFDTGRWRSLADLPAGEWAFPLEWRPGQLVTLHSMPDGSARTELVQVADGARTVLTVHRAPPQNASLSPDGQYLVFDEPDANGRGDIFIAAPGGAPRLLTGGPADDVGPVWTADGTRVVFTSDRTSRQALWAVDVADGQAPGDPRLLYSDSGVMGWSLGLTADGTFYYDRQIGLVNVYRLELDAIGNPVGEPQVAGERFFGATQGSGWGPGGALVYLSRVGQTLTQHITIQSPAGVERTLDTGMRSLRLLRWSPDGRWILGKGTDSFRQYGVNLLDPQTGRPNPVLTVPRAFETSLGQIGWSPEPETILYTRGGALWARRIGTNVDRRLVAVDPGGFFGQGLDTLRPEGAIAYMELRAAAAAREWSLRVLERDGSRRVICTVTDGPIIWPTWMPDGRSLLVVRPVSGSPSDGAIWRVERDTGALTPLGLTMRRLRNIDVSDDGRYVTFTSGSPMSEVWMLANFLPAPGTAKR